MKETNYIFIYPTIEVRINLTYLFEEVCDQIRLGISKNELDEDDFDEIDYIIENYCYDTICNFIESEIDETIEDLELEDVCNELVKMFIANIDEFKELCKK